MCILLYLPLVDTSDDVMISFSCTVSEGESCIETTWPFLSCKWSTIEMVSQDMHPLKRALINTTVAKCFSSCMVSYWACIPYAAVVPPKVYKFL
jgi:hypothetical protein